MDKRPTYLYQAIVEGASDPILTIEADRRITSWNAASERIFGYTPDEAIGKPISLLLLPEQKQEIESKCDEVFTGQSVRNAEALLHGKGDKTINASIALSPVPDSAGNIIGCSIIARDITEQKNSEASAELQHERLMQADKLSSLGVLAAGIVHEINNPNNYILLNSRILQKVWDDVLPLLKSYYETNGDFPIAGMPFSSAHEKIGQLVTGTADGAARIQRIVQSLKGLVHQDAGEMTQSVNLNEVIASALVIVNDLVKKSTNEFSVTYAEHLPRVKGNAQQLEQVIINLLTNSCHALRHREEAISVSTASDTTKKSVVVRVEDAGVGIPPEHLPHIFDLFFTTKHATMGTGLGLPVSHTIIKNHGGDLKFESEPGKGTIATIMLPMQGRGALQNGPLP